MKPDESQTYDATLTDDRLVVAVSSRALFDLDEEHRIFVERGLLAFRQHQVENEEKPLAPGPAFPLAKALLRLNRFGRGNSMVEVIVMSGNHPDCGIRVMRSCQHHGLDIRRSAFTGGAPVIPYLKPFKVDLLLSRNTEEAKAAGDQGIAAAVMFAQPESLMSDDGEVRVAMDGDAVSWGDEAEYVYRTEGLDAFLKHEHENADVPLKEGPFTRFLRVLGAIQRSIEETGAPKPIRIGLFTARGGPAYQRALKTLRAWGVELDEAFFLETMSKDRVLAAFRPHIFFDDNERHVSQASALVPSAQVPYRSDGAMAKLMETRA